MRAAFRPLRALALDSTATGGAGCWSTPGFSTRLTSKNSFLRQSPLLGAANFSSWRPQKLAQHEKRFSTTTSPLSAPVTTTGSVKNSTTEQQTRGRQSSTWLLSGYLVSAPWPSPTRPSMPTAQQREVVAWSALWPCVSTSKLAWHTVSAYNH